MLRSQIQPIISLHLFNIFIYPSVPFSHRIKMIFSNVSTPFHYLCHFLCVIFLYLVPSMLSNARDSCGFLDRPNDRCARQHRKDLTNKIKLAFMSHQNFFLSQPIRRECVFRCGVCLFIIYYKLWHRQPDGSSLLPPSICIACVGNLYNTFVYNILTVCTKHHWHHHEATIIPFHIALSTIYII